MSDLSELRRELREWEGTLHRRERDEQRRRAQAAKARRRAVRHRGAADAGLMARLARRAAERLAATRRAVHAARVAVSGKRRAIKRRHGRGRSAALAWCRSHLYKTEVPGFSNCTPWLPRDFGLRCCAWCGKWCGNALLAAGVKGVTSRILSVWAIEQDARAGRAPFTGWSDHASAARPGDLVVEYGHGVHVEVVHSVGRGVLQTYGGNTSPGAGGSQSNGGGSYPRDRPFSAVVGVAHVDYPS